MKSLSEKTCTPCEGGVEPLGRLEANTFLQQVRSEWELSEDTKRLKREFTFGSFGEAMKFVNAVARIADAEGHHPDMFIYFRKVVLKLTTHAIGGLSENDFILAAKIDELNI